MTSKQQTPDHDTHLSRAIELARRSVAAGGGPFGAVVTRGDEVLAEGANRVTLDRDPSAHAEVVAIRAACAAVGSHELGGCTVYASCEPCPMCLATLWWARVERVVFAATREDAAAAGFDDAAVYAEITRPLDERRLPLERRLAERGGGPFDDWRAKPDRVEY